MGTLFDYGASKTPAIIMLRIIVLSALVACALSAYVGGWQEADAMNDENVADILNFYMSSKNKPLGKLALKSVHTQIVSGINYKLTFYVARSLIECEAIVYHQPWTSTMKIIKDAC